METIVLQIIGSIVLPSVIAAGGAIGWFNRMSSKYMDEKFRTISEHIRSSDNRIERVERDLLEMQARLPKEFVMREEFISRMQDASKKMDYMVEQMDKIRSILLSRRVDD